MFPQHLYNNLQLAFYFWHVKQIVTNYRMIIYDLNFFS